MTLARTVSDLELDPARESALREAFAGWADHFRVNLRERGLRGLLAEYAQVVESVESQSCTHGKDGTRQTGSAWQYYCGVSYEFANDLAVRDAIAIILCAVGPEAAALPRPEIDALDARLHALYEHAPARTGAWWRVGLPRGILP